MIGKLDRDQRSGVRDQKKNDLRRGRRLDFGVKGLTKRKASMSVELAGLAR
jgi:hypothetical protein